MTGGMARGRGPVEFLALIQVLMFFPLANCGGTGSEAALDLGDAARITIKTAELSTGEVGVSYQATLEASGGTGPYNWRISAGVLPPGLSFDSKSGTISGTPVDAGDFSFTVQVSDSGKPSAAKGSRDLMIAIVPRLQIATTTLYSSYVGQPYEARLTSFGGIPPFRWDVASGGLPPGLGIESQEGKIKGTPAAGGRYAVVVGVRDSIQPVPATATKTLELILSDVRLDRYGGLADVPVAGGATGSFRAAKVGERWTLVTPEGNAFFMIGVYHISGDTHVDDLGGTYDRRAELKYGDRDVTWGPQQVRRVRSWGFNTIGPYSIRWVGPTARHNKWPGDHEQPEKMPVVGLFRPALYSLRNLDGRASGPVKDIVYGTNSHFVGYRSSFPDVFDPNFEQFLDSQLAEALGADTAGDFPWSIGVMIDDTDNLNGFGAGPDFPTIPLPGRNNRHLGWVTLITAPTQTSNPAQGVTYADRQVYTKHALVAFVRSRYETIEALNSAWGSNYTTFDSDGGWPDGNGLLDEDGRHTTWVGTDPVYLNDANSTVKKDLDDFLFQLASKYFQICRSRLKAHAPNMLYFGPTVVGSWGTPARRQVLEAAARYVDVLNSNFDVTDQQRLDFVVRYLGDKPIAYWTGHVANSDSALWRYPCTGCAANQSDRARHYEARADAYFRATATASGAKPSVGFIWWEFHDNYREKANWGLVTLSDNAYDGKEATLSGGRPGVVESARCRDAWGYPCGAEERDYGDFISTVRGTNLQILKDLMFELTAD